MADPVQNPEEDIVVRTMKGDLGIPVSKKEEKPVSTPAPAPLTFKETEFKAPEFKSAPAVPAPTPPTPPSEPIMPPVISPAPPAVKKPASPAGRPPVLVIPPIPPKEVPLAPTKPLFKTSPTWIKLGIIGLTVVVLALLGLYGYWKLFVQGQPAPTPTPPTATTTVPTLPSVPTATTTAPIKFFNKLPQKTITIDLPSKTPLALAEALKSEAKIDEVLSSVKQIKITYQGKPLETSEFLDLMAIFTPQNFLNNFENEFAFAYFRQKEGARPVLILKAKNANLAKTQMENWEKSALPSDVLPLFLTNAKLPAALPSFRSYLFIGQPVRFLNISIPFASLNYTLYGNFLVFTTSSSGMFVILQDLTGQTVSTKYLQMLEAAMSGVK